MVFWPLNGSAITVLASGSVSGRCRVGTRLIEIGHWIYLDPLRYLLPGAELWNAEGPADRLWRNATPEGNGEAASLGRACG